MGEAQPLKLNIMIQEGNEAKLPETTNVPTHSPINGQARDRKWWLRVSVYAVFVLSGESVATLLGRLYYDGGGNSKWMATLVQIAGFPILLPYYFLSTRKNPEETGPKLGVTALKASSVYLFLGVLNAAVCLLHSTGLFHLPVSTYSLICATQLSFSALFSFFLNAQRFTAYIVNSLVLLTISSALLLFQADLADPPGASGRRYAVGFVSTVCASAGYGLVLSLTQFSLQRVLKKESGFSAAMDTTVFVSLVSTLAAFAGLFGSGEWKFLRREMEGFELGKVSYVMTLTWATVSWQLFNIGAVGLILEVSSLFSNVISVLSLPVVPVMAVIFFHDRIDGVKVIAMVLAIWGLMSYVYQHYLESRKCRGQKRRNDSEKTDSSQEETVTTLWLNGVSVVQL